MGLKNVVHLMRIKIIILKILKCKISFFFYNAVLMCSLNIRLKYFILDGNR